MMKILFMLQQQAKIDKLKELYLVCFKINEINSSY